MADNNDNGDTAITVAAVGGGALLVWLLMRGRGRGFGGGGSGQVGGAAVASVAPSASPPVPQGPPCGVRVDGSGISVNGYVTDLATLGRSCRAAGTAEITVTGEALHGVAEAAIRELKRAGVTIARRGV